MTFRFEAETQNYLRFKQIDGINKLYLPKNASAPSALEEFSINVPDTQGVTT